MSHFYGGVQGGKGEATRCGFKNSGIRAYIKTWSTIMNISLHHSEDDGKNYYTVMGVTFLEEDGYAMAQILEEGAKHYYEMRKELET